jgi:hypothetical protein
VAASEFSEYTYATAVNIELGSRMNAAITSGRIQGYSAVGVAHVPSLTEEAILGYDVLFPFPEAAPLCFQYKLAASLSNRKRMGVIDKKLSTIQATLDNPSFEFEIKRKQNDTLLRLATQIKVKAFYCAPKFYTWRELNSHCANKQLLKRSFLLSPPTLVGPPEKHKVYFDLSRRRFICSEARELDGVYEYETLVEASYRERQPVGRLLEGILADLRSDLYSERQLWERVDNSWNETPEIKDERFYRRVIWLLRWIKLIVSLYYGAEFHLI